MLADKVLNQSGEVIGIATNRIRSTYYRTLISLCSIDQEYTKLGTEVFVLWGNHSTRQKKLRASVAKYPNNIENRNQKVDADKIPLGTMD